MVTKLNSEQVNDLARPLMGVLEKFYQDPKNEEAFRKWLQNTNKAKGLTETNA
jgi:hypothetical protein